MNAITGIDVLSGINKAPMPPKLSGINVLKCFSEQRVDLLDPLIISLEWSVHPWEYLANHNKWYREALDQQFGKGDYGKRDCIRIAMTVANIVRAELQNHDIGGVPLNDFEIHSNHLIDRATANTENLDIASFREVKVAAVAIVCLLEVDKLDYSSYK